MTLRLRWLRASATLLVGCLSVVACASDRRLAQLERRVDSLAVTLTAVTNRLNSAARPAGRDTATVSMGSGPAAGDPAARVVIVEFTDYQCPFCERHFETTLPRLRQAYVATGKARYVVRDLPLSQIHQFALPAARAARCAAAQGAAKYWAYHDSLFANQRRLSTGLFPHLAQATGLNVPQFSRCLTAPATQHAIDADLGAGRALGLSGTPGFVVGTAQGDGRVAGVVIHGAYPIGVFTQTIDSLLRASGRAEQ